MDRLWDIPFFLTKNSKLHLSLLGVRSIFMESIGTVALKNILSLKNIEKTKTSETEFFAKGYEKCKILSENFRNKSYKLG